MKSLLFESGGHSLQIAWMLLRVSVGIIFITHGYPKLVGGVEKWDWMGQQMSLVGINFWPRFWGFLAAAAESAGGLLLIFGLFTRISSLLMLGTMIIALVFLIKSGKGYDAISHPLQLVFVFAAFLLAGGGKYSLDQWLFMK